MCVRFFFLSLMVFFFKLLILLFFFIFAFSVLLKLRIISNFIIICRAHSCFCFSVYKLTSLSCNFFNNKKPPTFSHEQVKQSTTKKVKPSLGKKFYIFWSKTQKTRGTSDDRSNWNINFKTFFSSLFTTFPPCSSSSHYAFYIVLKLSSFVFFKTAKKSSHSQFRIVPCESEKKTE